MTETRIIDIRTITADGPQVHFIATDTEKKELAERFDIPTVNDFKVTGKFGYDRFITFDGTLSTSNERICVATLKPFTEKNETVVHLLFTDNQQDIEQLDEDLILVKKGKINLFEVFAEEFGLSLNPFPKSIDTYLDYQDPTTSNTNPFAILKQLKKKG